MYHLILICTSTSMDPQILNIHRSSDSGIPTSMGAQIPGYLYLYMLGSSYLFIHALTDPNICRSSDVSISTSMDPWILWFSDVYMHRSSDPQILVCRICTSMDPQISMSVHPQICRYSDLLTDLWIFLSLHPQICQYFIMPHWFLQEWTHSTGTHRSPQEWHRNPQEWTRIHRNGQEWHWNGTGMD